MTASLYNFITYICNNKCIVLYCTVFVQFIRSLIINNL